MGENIIDYGQSFTITIMIISIYHLLIFLFSLFISIGTGLAINHHLKLKYNFIEESLILSFGFGLVIIIYITSLFSILNNLGQLQVYFFSGILFIISLLYSSRILSFDQLGELFNYSKNKNRIVLIGIGSISLIYLFSAMAPLLDGDSLSAYLDIPRRFVFHGGIVSLPYELYNSTPLNMQMLSVFSLIIGDDILAQMMVGYAMTMGTAFVIFIICKRFYTKEIGLYAMLFFLTTYVVEFLIAGTKVNAGRAFFDLF